jgi:hypothetical protein
MTRIQEAATDGRARFACGPAVFCDGGTDAQRCLDDLPAPMR